MRRPTLTVAVVSVLLVSATACGGPEPSPTGATQGGGSQPANTSAVRAETKFPAKVGAYTGQDISSGVAKGWNYTAEGDPAKLISVAAGQGPFDKDVAVLEGNVTATSEAGSCGGKNTPLCVLKVSDGTTLTLMHLGKALTYADLATFAADYVKAANS